MAGTVEKINGVVFFDFEGTMITKKGASWFNKAGTKINGNLVAGFLRRSGIECRQTVIQYKSVINRYFGGNYKFDIK